MKKFELRQIIREEVRKAIGQKSLTETRETKKTFFFNLFTAAQKQGKFKELADMLDEDYGIWFTDDPDVSQSDLKSLINRSDFSILTSKDIKDIADEVKRTRIVKI